MEDAVTLSQSLNLEPSELTEDELIRSIDVLLHEHIEWHDPSRL